MNFVKTTVLSTREQALGARKLGQVVPVPSGRLDKVSVYLEPEITDESIAMGATVILEVFASDGFGLPTGPVLAFDTKTLSAIKSRSMVNFSLAAFVPTTSVLVLSVSNGDLSNLVSWRYLPSPSSGQELLISEDSGATWVMDTTRKFAYVAYSLTPNAVDSTEQTALIQPGTLKQVLDDSGAEFSISALDRAVVQGDTVVVEFGDVVVTLVVDNSGSMTWNDADGLRYDFLKDYIDDLESIMPPGSTASYSIVKFRSRQIGRMSLTLQQDVDEFSLAGVRVVRKIGSKPNNASDGIVVYEGLAQEILDTNLAVGTTYHYGAFTFDGAGNFSSGGRTDFAQATASPKPPVGVAGLRAVEKIIKVGNFDIGQRKVQLTWANPQGFDYTDVILVKRDDRAPESPTDGTVILSATSATTSFLDFDPAADAINGLTYYYRIFTIKSGLKCLQANARSAQVAISLVDRVWEKAEAPFDVPPIGFDSAAPAAPAVTVTPGNGRILLEFTAADADTKRFKVFYNEEKYPQAMTGTPLVMDYDGDLVFEGTATEFVHEQLDNGQPHFYVIVAVDAVGNQSAAVLPPVTRPQATLTNVLPLANVSEFSAEAVNSTTNRILWKFPFSDVSSVEAWFGDTVRAISTVTFTDANAKKTSAVFSFVEGDRIVKNYFEDDPVDPEVAVDFARSPSAEAGTIVGTIAANPIVDIQNKMSSTLVQFNSSLRVEERSTGALIQEIITGTASVTLKNPFEIAIHNDPPQTVSKRTFKGTCTEDESPEEGSDQFAGVYVRTGESFLATVEASFRGAALEADVTLAVRILDKETNLPSSIVRLPQTNDEGYALLVTSTVVDELIDRAGQPTGETVNKTIIDIALPPQDVPGDYLIEVTGSYLGYLKTTTLEVHFETSLNIDLDLKAFQPDGVNSTEQKAFVYFGAFDAPLSEKTPAPDNTVVEWSLSLLGGNAAGKPRPFYSLDGVPGKGVKSYTHGGIARNVFFGPGTDVEPPTNVICTDGEMWAITAKAKVSGMTAETTAVVELLPPRHEEYNRIFLRLAADQPDGNPPTSLASDLRFADGEDTVRYEVVARPELDILPSTDERSGLWFVDKIVNPPVSGQFAPLEEGRIVTMNASIFAGGISRKDVIITTNMTGTSGAGGTAKAKVSGGRAVFDIKLNARVVGVIEEAPLQGETPSNPVYNPDSIVWQESPIIVSLSVFTVAEVSGRPVVFSGGGSSLESSSPPAFISYKEPLE